MEARFGYDFSAVRLHTDGRAAESARALKAHAYTVGNDIAFNEGQFAPDSFQGRTLLAHELTHVIQNTPTTIQRQAEQGTSLLPDLLNRGTGTVANQTDKVFVVEASEFKEGAKVMALLKPGTWGGSTPLPGPKGEKLHDIDFVFATPTTPINGQTKGKFKIGSNDATISPDPKNKLNSMIDDFTGYIDLATSNKAADSAGKTAAAPCPSGKPWIAGRHIAPRFHPTVLPPMRSERLASYTDADKLPNLPGEVAIDCKDRVWRYQLGPFVSDVTIQIVYFMESRYPAPSPTDDTGELTNVMKENCKDIVDDLHRNKTGVHRNFSAYKRDWLHENYHYEFEWQPMVRKFVPEFESAVEKIGVPFALAGTEGQARSILERSVRDTHASLYGRMYKKWADPSNDQPNIGAYLAQAPAIENMINRVLKYAKTKKWLPSSYSPK